jgi:hypothetical protein
VPGATEDAPVFERENRLHRRSEEWIQSILAEKPVDFRVETGFFFSALSGGALGAPSGG